MSEKSKNSADANHKGREKGVSVRVQYKPLIGKRNIRILLSLILFVASFYSAQLFQGPDRPDTFGLALMVIIIWLPSVFLTDKYRHKYPQRYYSYLFASHLKSAVIAGAGLGVLVLSGAVGKGEFIPALRGLGLFLLADFVLSLPRKRDRAGEALAEQRIREYAQATGKEQSSPREKRLPLMSFERASILEGVEDGTPERRFLEKHLPETPEDADGNSGPAEGGRAFMPTEMLNDVKYMSRYLQSCTEALAPGGYLLARYRPMAGELAAIRARHTGLRGKLAVAFHFLFKRALPKIPGVAALYYLPQKINFVKSNPGARGWFRRALPKAEVWGRLAYWGFQITAEEEQNGESFILARRVYPPSDNKKPSYYAVVALEKVGINGEPVRLHKIRSMYPFSEFAQKQMYEMFGLTKSGKFANDFRLTDYGPFIRKYWLDELPQVFDWLRGEVKLVGMRATSPHFLSLYPKELYACYIQVMPGLVPPIFDEKTAGFDEIVQTELEYLHSYWEKPVRTDVKLFIRTFTDIFIRGTRSN